MNEELAVPRPVMPVSDAEQNALRELMPKLSTDGCEVKAAKIKSDSARMFDVTEAVEIPTFLERQNSEEQKKIESQIAELRRSDS